MYNGTMDKPENGSLGQAALIIILIMMVSSTVALAVIQQSIKEISLTRTEESASKALSAAEAGIEEGLRTLTVGNSSGSFGTTNFNLDVAKAGSDGYLSDTAVLSGNSLEIPVAGLASPPTSIDIYWGDKADTNQSPLAALEVRKYQKYGDSDYRVVESAYDPDSTRATTDKFSAPTLNPGSVLGVSFGARVSISIDATDQYIRLRPVFNQAKVGIVPQPNGTQLPTLQYKITSTGKTDDGLVRKIEVTRDQPALPSVFDFSVYSGTSLVQN